MKRKEHSKKNYSRNQSAQRTHRVEVCFSNLQILFERIKEIQHETLQIWIKVFFLCKERTARYFLFWTVITRVLWIHLGGVIVPWRKSQRNERIFHWIKMKSHSLDVIKHLLKQFFAFSLNIIPDINFIKFFEQKSIFFYFFQKKDIC